ncbi:MAG: hypothetical protein ABR520_07350 [Mycobacteriales bacterium]|nr:hypothetical protein [Frankia sp.]
MVVAVAGVVLSFVNGDVDVRIGIVVAVLAYPVVGAVVAARRPHNVVGWLLLLAGCCLVVLVYSEQYALWALAPGTHRPGGLVVAWLSGWVYAPILGVLVFFLPLLFPTGRLLTARWRPVLWCGIAFVVLAVVSNALLPDNVVVSGVGRVRNPFAWDAQVGAVRFVNNLTVPFLLVSAVGSIAALVVRFRRSRDVERQQLKLFTYAAALTPVPFMVYGFSEYASQLAYVLLVPLVPLAVGFAVLRYRLFDIDRLISRTVSYAIVTVLIAVPYLLLVPLVTKVVGGSSVAVAAGTLAAAAAFNPLRRRVQAGVDRRFNRARYDAQHTVESFAARLRDEVDLDTLTIELLGVVRATMQPATAALWLRPPATS